MKSALVVQELLESDLVVSRRRHPELASTIDRMIRDRRLAAVLPGVYTWPTARADLRTRLAAVSAWDRDAVVLGRAAAQQTFWPKIHVNQVEVAARGRGTKSPGFDIRQRTVGAEHVLERRELRLTIPPLTALDLTGELGAAPIDELLRSRQATLADLHAVLAETSQRAGNLGRRELLLDSRDEPWSHSERVAHRLLRGAGISGWRANLEVSMLGSRYYLDIAFERQRLAIEIDGREYHGVEAFEYDRWRQNDIIFAGWHLLRFTADTVINRGAIFVAQVKRALDLWGEAASDFRTQVGRTASLRQ